MNKCRCEICDEMVPAWSFNIFEGVCDDCFFADDETAGDVWEAADAVRWDEEY